MQSIICHTIRIETITNLNKCIHINLSFEMQPETLSTLLLEKINQRPPGQPIRFKNEKKINEKKAVHGAMKSVFCCSACVTRRRNDLTFSLSQTL